MLAAYSGPNSYPQWATIKAKKVYFIRLGSWGEWAPRALKEGELALGHPAIPHDICLSGDWRAVSQLLGQIKPRKTRPTSAALADLRMFYESDDDTLWVTSSGGFLWWGIAETEIRWNGSDCQGYGARIRRISGGWRQIDLQGDPLLTAYLEGGLIPVLPPDRSIVAIDESSALIRRINCRETAVLGRARLARAEMIAATAAMIEGLSWSDFVMLVEMAFAGAGWRRVSSIVDRPGGAAFVAERLAPAQTAQVFLRRCGTAQDSIEECEVEMADCDQTFIVKKSARGRSPQAIRDDVEIWSGGRLAELAIAAGSYGWLVERAR
jgi:hypothetical protein